ncbi:MAG: hypothetical protein JW969_05500 [Spirochaetales bacterium]|nr:hypothetical protein [Spirochaetales bacterium]
MMKRRVNKIPVFFFILAWALVSCSDSGEKKAAEDFAINKEYERGPIKVNLKADKKELTIAEKLNVDLEIRIDRDHEIEMPDFPESEQQFKVADYHDAPSRLLDDKQVLYVRKYVLEPFLSGDYKIPSLKVLFWSKSEGRDKAHEIETEAVDIKVNSILAEDMKDLAIADISGPVALPPPDLTIPLLIGGGTLFLILVGAAVFMYFYYFKEKKKVELTVPAHELAYDQLEALIKEDLIAKGEYKLFYFVLSDILRHYIENRFRIRAPEQTTEEFLEDVKNRDALDSEQKSLLTDFLAHCDLVKFAEYVPEGPEIEKAFNTCRDFIQATENKEVQVVQPEGTEAAHDTV